MCFALFSLAISSAQQGKSASELYKEAVAADERAELDKAIALYKQLLVLQPGSLLAHSNLGADLASTGRYAEAVTEYQQALKIEPKNRVVRLNLALARYKQGEIQKAAETLAALHQEDPSNKQILYLLADCYLRLGRDSDVIELLTPVHKADHNDEAVQYALGTAYIREGKIPEGQAVIDPILKNGNTPEANLLMGEVQFAAGDYKTAAATLRKATDLNPNLPGACCGDSSNSRRNSFSASSLLPSKPRSVPT